MIGHRYNSPDLIFPNLGPCILGISVLQNDRDFCEVVFRMSELVYHKYCLLVNITHKGVSPSTFDVEAESLENRLQSQLNKIHVPFANLEFNFLQWKPIACLNDT